MNAIATVIANTAKVRIDPVSSIESSLFALGQKLLLGPTWSAQAGPKVR
jgi:hypothetical protein